MDRLLLHQLIGVLTKSSDTCDFERMCNLFDRLLTITNDSSIYGQVLWYSCSQPTKKQFTNFIISRFVENQSRLPISSIVNYKHTYESLSALQLVSRHGDVDLINLLLQLGANVWKSSTHGKVAFHFAAKNAEQDGISSIIIETIRVLCQHMNDEPLANELFRKFAIVPAAIETNSSVIVQTVLSQMRTPFEMRLLIQYYEHSLQAMVDSDVIDCILKQIKKVCKQDILMQSPIDLAMQYNNLHAMRLSIDLGFKCSDQFVDNIFLHLRRTLISERQPHLFTNAYKCFRYLIDQIIERCENDENNRILNLLHNLIEYKFSFKVCHRLNEPEVVVNGNYLTFSLLNHCGSISRCLSHMPIPIQFQVENNLLKYYRFSRHDEPVLQYLIQQNRLHFELSQNKIMTFFEQNCYPLYDITIRDSNEEVYERPDNSNDEYVLDKIRFQHFKQWLNKFCFEVQSLTTLSRNVIIHHYLNNFNGDWNVSNLKSTMLTIGRIRYLKQYFGNSMFDHIFNE